MRFSNRNYHSLKSSLSWFGTVLFLNRLSIFWKALSWRQNVHLNPSPLFLDATHVFIPEQHVCFTLESCFLRKSLFFSPKFYHFPLTIWQRGRLCTFVAICVSVGFFSVLTYDNIGQHEMAFFFLAEGGLLHNSHKKRSLLIVFCRVVYAHIMRACVWVCVHVWLK